MSAEKLAIERGEKAVGELGPYPAKIGRDDLCKIINHKEKG